MIVLVFSYLNNAITTQLTFRLVLCPLLPSYTQVRQEFRISFLMDQFMISPVTTVVWLTALTPPLNPKPSFFFVNFCMQCYLLISLHPAMKTLPCVALQHAASSLLHPKWFIAELIVGITALIAIVSIVSTVSPRLQPWFSKYTVLAILTSCLRMFLWL